MLERISRNQQALVGLVCAAVLALSVTVATKASFGAYDPGYTLTARFAEAGQNLDTQSDVKIRGVNVGRVTGIDVGRDGRAVVTMRIDPGTDVPRTAVAAIRPISIFGPKFVDLVPGDGEGRGPFYGDGDEIAHTATALELSDVLAHADALMAAVDPQDLTTILHTFADGIDGLDQPMSRSIDDARTLLDATLASTDDRHRLLDAAAALAGELADEGPTILRLADGVHQPTETLGEHQDELAGGASVGLHVGGVEDDDAEAEDHRHRGHELYRASHPGPARLDAEAHLHGVSGGGGQSTEEVAQLAR